MVVEDMSESKTHGRRVCLAPRADTGKTHGAKTSHVKEWWGESTKAFVCFYVE